MTGTTDKGVVKAATIGAVATIIAAIIGLATTLINGHVQKQVGIEEGQNMAAVATQNELETEYSRGFSEGKNEVELSIQSLLTEEYNKGYTQGQEDQLNLSTTSQPITETETEVAESVFVIPGYPPVADKWGYQESNTMKMNGKTYGNGFILESPGKIEDYYIKINVDNKFSKLEFDLGHIDGEPGHDDGTFVFYIDHNYITTIVKSPKDSVTHEIVELNYGELLRIEYKTGWAGYFDKYGFANVTLVR